MDSGRTATKTIKWKFPKTTVSTAVIGDSQTKYMFQHFDPLREGTPAFITQFGAVIRDVHGLLDFVPSSTTTLILHVGTNDLVHSTGRVTFHKYKALLQLILSKRPMISRIYATLLLPRALNRRRDKHNEAIVRHCNREACDFNDRLRSFCCRSDRVFFLDHALEWFPSVRVLAADGLHPNFEGVALMAGHIKQLCFRNATDASSSSWLDHMPSGPMKQSSNAYQPGFVELASSPRSSSPQRLQVPEIYTEPLAQEKSTYATVAAKAKNQGLSTRERSGNISLSHRYPLRKCNREKSTVSSKN